MMTGEAEFIDFLRKWAKKQHKRFVIESFDQHEMDDTIDGIRAADVWGWLIDEDENIDEDELQEGHIDEYGCIEWSIQDGEIKLEFRQY